MQQFEAIKKQFIAQLGALYEPAEAKSIFFMLLEDVFGYNRNTLLSGNPITLNEVQTAQLITIIKRLCSGEPIQQIIGATQFMGISFKVNKDVLIPRPETEELVDFIIQDLKQSKVPVPSIIDIGTGSGCIPITIKKYVTDATVFAMDISHEALAVAKENATDHQCTIQFMQADILEWDVVFAENLLYDIIVSNPPYITNSEQAFMHPNVLQFEPHLALFVEDQAPLLFYETIASFALVHLAKGGKLYFEINRNFGQEVKNLLQKKGFKDILLKQDMHGADRMIRASL